MKYLISIIILLIFQSCNKKELSFEIEVKVHDKTFNQALAGAEITFFEFTPTSTIGNPVKEIKTNSEGKIEVKFEHKRILKYEVLIRKENYMPRRVIIYFDDLKPNEMNSFSYEIGAKTWFEFTFTKAPNTPTIQELKINKQGFLQNCDFCCPNGFEYHYGVENFSLNCETEAHQNILFFYWVNGNEDFGEYDIYTQPFDTIKINVVH